MNRPRLLLAMLAGLAPGCAGSFGHFERTNSPCSVTIIALSDGATSLYSYVIDSASRSCFFQSPHGIAALPCESLLQVPAAVRVITWLPGAPPPAR